MRGTGGHRESVLVLGGRYGGGGEEESGYRKKGVESLLCKPYLT